jgi:hypothetical protein
VRLLGCQVGGGVDLAHPRADRRDLHGPDGVREQALEPGVTSNETRRGAARWAWLTVA